VPIVYLAAIIRTTNGHECSAAAAGVLSLGGSRAPCVLATTLVIANFSRWVWIYPGGSDPAHRLMNSVRDRPVLSRFSFQCAQAFSGRSLLYHEMQTRHPARQDCERIRCDPRDSRLIVQPIRSNAAKTLRVFAEPHWLMPPQLKRLFR
jgi:hypothetical protein